MLTDTFSKALNTIDDRYLLEAMGEGTARRKRPRMALRLCAAAVTALLLVGTALAVSPALRQAVREVLFPRYTAETFQEVDAGHRTGSFDRMDTLFTFLETWNRENMGDGVYIQKENGFSYTVVEEEETTAEVLVLCQPEEKILLVRMERIPYDGTAGLWQVTGYQLLDRVEGEMLLNP